MIANFSFSFSSTSAKKIDGCALLKLTDEDITQLLSEVDENGVLQRPTIGAQSRFRAKVMNSARIAAQERKERRAT
jgi:hypothetical protein